MHHGFLFMRKRVNMALKFMWNDRVSEEVSSALNNIYNEAEHKFFLQNPEWLRVSPDQRPIITAQNAHNEIVGYAGVEVKPLRTVHISFGPVCRRESDLSEIIPEMVQWLKKRKVWRFSIQLPYPCAEGGDALIPLLKSKVSFRQSEKFFNWKSVRLSLEKEPEQILKSFALRHRQSIQKSRKAGLISTLISSREQVNILVQDYISMYKRRNLSVDRKKINDLISCLYDFLSKTKSGFFLGSFLNNKLLGGIIIVYQGNTAFYYLGATGNSEGNLPVLHDTFFNAMQISRNAGMKFFDFGGYAVGAAPPSQLYKINFFKLSFGAEPIEYPGQLVFDLSPTFSRVADLAMEVKRRWKKK